jgi:hypothetical protein
MKPLQMAEMAERYGSLAGTVNKKFATKERGEKTWKIYRTIGSLLKCTGSVAF